MTQPVLIDGRWREADATSTFQADNPATCEALADQYPVSSWKDCDAALHSASQAASQLRKLPADRIASFLEAFADRIEARKDEICLLANQETALPVSPRLADIELPRTCGQLRAAAAAARDGSWRRATIDTKTNIRSILAPLGPVCVFGPNNFPLAFGSVSGGDFAAAIAAGNPVIAKANSSHPGTTKLLAEEALLAAQATEMPTGIVQLIYRTSHADGERLVSDPRIGATGYTGSRSAGLKLKAAADTVGKPIYLELSSVNPVAILPGALAEKGDALVDEFTGSCLMGTGQFCTNPGMVLLLASQDAEKFVAGVTQKFASAPVGTLLSKSVATNMAANIATLTSHGAQVLTGGTAGGGTGYSHANTLLRVSGANFLANPIGLQEEAFGNASLIVVADDLAQAQQVFDRLEGNLTGCIYSATDDTDDQAYDALAFHLRPRVGRLLNDKMPTGVAVTPAMNHGGPFPATGHPGFTAVGIPAALDRFAMLQCFDSIRPHRLPAELADKNPTGNTWRIIDGNWTQGNA